MRPPRYFSVGLFHLLFAWGHDWTPNGMEGGRGYTCWRCAKRKIGKPYAVKSMNMAGTDVWEITVSDPRLTYENGVIRSGYDFKDTSGA